MCSAWGTLQERSLIVAPLRLHGQAVGAISVQSARANAYDRGDLELLSAIGNDAAEIALSTIHDVDLFIVGQAAPQETRREMVNWLKARFPGVKILAINPPGQQVFGADFNVRENDPERWLQVVTQRLGNTTIDLAGRHSAS